MYAVYRFQQISDIVYRRSKQQQEGQEGEEEQEAQSVDMWLLTDSTLAQLMDPQLAAPTVQFLVLEVLLHTFNNDAAPCTACSSTFAGLHLCLRKHLSL